MGMGEDQSAATAAELATAWLTEVVSVEGLDRCDGYVGPDCAVHVDGATIDWWGLRSLVEAYAAVFPAHSVDVVHVATWRDKAMIAYTTRYAAPDVVATPLRATAFLTVADGRIAEAWLLDDWPDWLERQRHSG